MTFEWLHHAYHWAEHVHLAYGFPLMLKEIGHWAWNHRQWMSKTVRKIRP